MSGARPAATCRIFHEIIGRLAGMITEAVPFTKDLQLIGCKSFAIMV